MSSLIKRVTKTIETDEHCIVCDRCGRSIPQAEAGPFHGDPDDTMARLLGHGFGRLVLSVPMYNINCVRSFDLCPECALIVWKRGGGDEMHEAFEVHMLTDEGKEKAKRIAGSFDKLLAELSVHCSEGRELAIVKTKLEEACFFAKKSMAKKNCVAQ